MSTSCHDTGTDGLEFERDRTLTVALAGNPNVGKTSVFNALTGLNQHVGNWPGKTVTRKDGFVDLGGARAVLTDLPGTYSLTAHTMEETVSRDFIIKEQPDLVINVVDASNLERNLYLTTELLELPSPVVVVLNMVDLAEARGYQINILQLEERLGVPVFPVVATAGKGLEQVLSHLRVDRAGRCDWRGKFRFSLPVEGLIARLIALLEPLALDPYPKRWLAIKLIEEDLEAQAMVKAAAGPAAFAQVADLIAEAIPDGALVLADQRYEWVERALGPALRRPASEVLTPSDRIDLVVTHRWFGLPITVAILGLSLWGAYKIAIPLQSLVQSLFTGIGTYLGTLLSPLLPDWTVQLITGGLLAWVGAVATFAPLVASFFIFLGVLEDSGFFARAAFVLDRILHRFGLHGKSGIGLLIGYGCNVPAVMAARTADNDSDRLHSILLAPLVICSARLVVITFFAGAFFPPGAAAWVMLGIYGLGIALTLGVSYLFRRHVVKGEHLPFFIELPSYRLPTVRNVLLYAWHQSWSFLHRAATVIAPMVVVIWFLSYFPGGQVDRSLLATLGRLVAPLGAPLGFTWRMVVALFTGFLAKEGTLATLAVLYGGGDRGGLATVLPAAVSAPQALSFLVFYTFYTPCLATAVTIRNETRSQKWMYFSILYSLALSAGLALAVYRLASAIL